MKIPKNKIYHIYCNHNHGYDIILVLGNTEKERLQNLLKHERKYNKNITIKDIKNNYIEQDAFPIDFSKNKRVIELNIT